MSLSGKVALVTGAAQGIGRAFSEVLLRRGAKVCISDVNTQQGETTVSEFQKQFNLDQVCFVKCDVADETQFTATFAAVKARYGRIDIVVNNAGIADQVQWSKLIDVNLKGVIHGTMLAVEAMRKDKGGAGGLVVNTASVAGLMPTSPSPTYAASKYGVVGYTLSMAADPNVESMGMSFSCICPAFVDTDMNRQLLGSDDKVIRQFLAEEGLMPISKIQEAFEKLLDTPYNNGVVVTSGLKKGTNVRRELPKLW